MREAPDSAERTADDMADAVEDENDFMEAAAPLAPAACARRPATDAPADAASAAEPDAAALDADAAAPSPPADAADAAAMDDSGPTIDWMGAAAA